ncbi:hypothetical protein CKM354_000637200 [Cercospora kikuchii]|uniref:Uncharacterized protein n=1 Tax=Cercospora kikuchii TaxID=84275 RepID=A0A9P3CI14_9PEZI|nr:uncharacterized protein CKM354_000637200 [Cercospora kikuchii]GIZ43133.1 hypothetical protein CKM354_000637200 [Cercospora kikuchii]
MSIRDAWMLARTRSEAHHENSQTPRAPTKSDPMRKRTSKNAWINLVCKHVSASMRCRIPNTAKVDMRSLWDFLTALSRPFRFLDLSKEVRQRIYSLALEEQHAYSDALPPLLSVNKQIREEASPAFYTETLFTGDVWSFTEDANPHLPSKEVDAMVHWSRSIAHDCIRLLRKFELLYKVEDSFHEECYVTITFHYSPETGLSYCLNEERCNRRSGILSEQSIAVLDKHIAHVDQLRRTLHLQGESIIMALVSWPELWEPGSLSFE